MTLIIENVKEEFLPTFNGLAEVIKARLGFRENQRSSHCATKLRYIRAKSKRPRASRQIQRF